MSTYFETYYPSGTLEVQLSDKYLGFCISRSGTVKANFSQGELYGFELNSNESFVIARTNNDTLVISPIYKLSGGNSVVYMGTQNGSDIQYKVISLSKNIGHNEHNSGIEIYNENGELVFTNANSVIQFERNYICNATHWFVDDYGYCFTRLYDAQWQQATIDDSSNKYIYSMQAPFGLSNPYDGSPAMNSPRRPWTYAGGYKFENNKITTLTKSICPNNGRVTKLLGGGTIDHLGKQYYYSDEPGMELDYWCGIWSGMYNFSTVLA